MSQRTEEDSEEPDEYVHYLRLKRREQLIHYFQSQFPALPGCYHIGIQKLFKHEFDMCKASHEHRETWRRKLADFPNRMRIRKRMRDEGYKTKCIPWRALDGRIISYEIPEEMGVVRKRSTSASFNQTVRDDDEDTEEQEVTRTYNYDRFTETRRIPNPRSEGWCQFQWEMHERQQPRPATPYIPRQPTGTRETANRQTFNSYSLNEIRECHIPRPLPAAHGPNNNSGSLQTPGAELEQYRIARQKPVELPSRPNPIPPPSNIAQYGFGYTGQLAVPNNSPHRQSAKPRQQAQPSESSFRTGGWEAPAASSSTFGVHSHTTDRVPSHYNIQTFRQPVEAGQPSHHLPWTGSTARHGGFTIDEDQESCTFGMTPACSNSSNDRRRHRGRSRRRKCARLQSTPRAQQASSYSPENWGNNPHQAPKQQPNCSNFSTAVGSFGQPMHGFVDRQTTTPRQQRAARRSLYSPDGWGNGPILQNTVQPVPAVANSTRPLDSGDHRAPRQSTTRNSPPRRQFSRSPAQCRGRSSSPRPDALSRPKGEDFPFLVQLKVRKEAAERRARERLDTERSQSTVNSIHSDSPCSSRELFNCAVLMEGEAEERNSLAVNEAAFALANLQIRKDPPGPSLTAAEAIALFIKYLADRHPEPVLHSELFELIFKRLTRFDEMDTFFQFVRSPHVLIGGGDPNRYSLASLEQTRKRLPQIKELTWAANRENVRQKLELIFSTSTTGIVSLQSITKFMQIASDELKRLPQCYPRLFRISSPGQLQIIRD